MWRRYRVELIISVILGIAASFVIPWPLQGRSADAIAHDHAEHVLWPAFVAKMNAWVFNHPMSDPHHLQNLDVADLKRYREARKAWHDFEEEMKLAGY